ncbi:glutathione peroxidase gpx1 [Mortierella hygrophila]|uniref:Glutathione peroxidase n=1 Tax=Mortierella hygrophila TaxID=979708 RepID=A0A9P6K0S7_9FUNG|nr:glutathione peroxidase gpx1 [Mortierella hygrophila]
MNSFKALRAPAGRLLFTRALAGTTAIRVRASGQATANQVLSSRVAFASAGAGAAFTTHSHTHGTKHDGGPTTNFFELKAKGNRHQEVSMSDFENKVILVVNVASKCGFTDQYAELESIYKKYKDKGFTVIGFPCNQFGGQEPGTEEEIESFCQVNFGVTFPLMAKIDVNGKSEDPVYTFLKSQKSGLLGLTRIKWNFEKFLIRKDGTVYERYSSATSPTSIAKDIEKLLAEQ